MKESHNLDYYPLNRRSSTSIACLVGGCWKHGKTVWIWIFKIRKKLLPGKDSCVLWWLGFLIGWRDRMVRHMYDKYEPTKTYTVTSCAFSLHIYTKECKNNACRKYQCTKKKCMHSARASTAYVEEVPAASPVHTTSTR